MEIKKINPGDTANKVAQTVYDNDTALQSEISIKANQTDLDVATADITKLTSDIDGHLNSTSSHITHLTMEQVDNTTLSGVYNISERLSGKGYINSLLIVLFHQPGNANFSLCHQKIIDINNKRSRVRTGKQEKNTPIVWGDWISDDYIPNGTPVNEASISSETNIYLNATEYLSLTSQHSQIHEVLGKGDIQLNTEDGDVTVNGKKVATVDIITQNVGDSTTLAPSQKLFTKHVYHSTADNWSDALASLTPLTLFDNNLNDPLRPKLLPKVQNIYNILPFAYTDGERSHLIHDRGEVSKTYMYNEVDHSMIELVSIDANATTGDILVYDGSKWNPSNKALQEMESQFLANNFTIPFIPYSDNPHPCSITISVAEEVTLYANDELELFSNLGMTNRLPNFFSIKGKGSKIWIKHKKKATDNYNIGYVSLINGIEKIIEFDVFGSALYGGNTIPVYDSRYIPVNMTRVYLGGSFNVKANINLDNFKDRTSLTYIHFVHLYNSNNVSVYGSLNSLKGLTKLTYFRIQECVNVNVSGEASTLVDLGVRQIYISKNKGGLTFNKKTVKQDIELELFHITSDNTWTSQHTDNCLIALNNINKWSGVKQIDLGTVAAPTSASQQAQTQLVEKGVTLTLNS